MTNLFKWFKENHLKANGEDCHLLVTTNKPTFIDIKGNIITSGQKENLLGIKFNSALSFENRVTDLCKKVILKLHALATVATAWTLIKLKPILGRGRFSRGT